jgi:hypothetical protein
MLLKEIKDNVKKIKPFIVGFNMTSKKFQFNVSISQNFIIEFGFEICQAKKKPIYFNVI